MILPMFAAASISAPGWLMPAAIVVALSLILLWWGYRTAVVRPGEKLIAATLKLLGIAALTACLVEPLWTGQRVKPGANYFALLADNSQGMCIKDSDAHQARNELVTGLLRSERGKW